MNKLLILVLPLAFAGAGCMTMSLERHTVNQIQSAADYRYHATLHSLAMVAANPATLPSYALLSNGINTISHTGVFNPMTTWKGNPLLFASEALAITGTHSPQMSWTVSPVADHTQLEAMRCACRWVLEGPEHISQDCVHILADPEEDTCAGPHFGVMERLARLPRGWLHFGRLCEVPAGACYKDHCGDTWVWVMRDGTEGLAEFTLVLQDIATLNVAPSDGSLPANKTPPLLVTLGVSQDALPQTVDIIIQTKDGQVTYRRADDNSIKPRQIVVTFGQSVVWHNNDTREQTATSIKGLFDTGKIAGGKQSKAIKFDEAMFKKANGKPGEGVILEYNSTTTDNSKSNIILVKDNPYASAYSSTLVFRVDRVIKPEYKHEIETRIREAIQNQPQAVAISWNEWMEWTTPFQGQRTSVKPGAATTTPITIPPTRLSTIPSGDQLQSLRRLLTLPSGDRID